MAQLSFFKVKCVLYASAAGSYILIQFFFFILWLGSANITLAPQETVQTTGAISFTIIQKKKNKKTKSLSALMGLSIES